MSSQKRECIIVTTTPHGFSTSVHVLSLIVNIYDKSSVVRNIHRSFEGCRQTFEDYKLTFVHALLHGCPDM